MTIIFLKGMHPPKDKRLFYIGSLSLIKRRTSSDNIAYGVATETSGNVYVAGKTLGGLNGNTNNAGMFAVLFCGGSIDL